jgi:hypothetical protein
MSEPITPEEFELNWDAQHPQGEHLYVEADAEGISTRRRPAQTRPTTRTKTMTTTDQEAHWPDKPHVVKPSWSLLVFGGRVSSYAVMTPP